MDKIFPQVSVYPSDAERLGRLAAVTKMDVYDIMNDILENFFVDQCGLYGVTQEELDEVEEW